VSQTPLVHQPSLELAFSRLAAEFPFRIAEIALYTISARMAGSRIKGSAGPREAISQLSVSIAGAEISRIPMAHAVIISMILV